MQEMEKYFLIIIWGTILLILIIVISIMFLLQYQKKHKKFIEQQNNFQQTLLQSQLEIQEKTLKNISQEIHDNIGQVLSLVKLNLYTMDIADNDNIITKIENSKELVSKAITDLRDLSHSMNTDYIEEKGLVKAIEYELEMIKRTGSHTIIFEFYGKIIPLPKQKELIVFRIIQEALHNIIKHANAEKIEMTVKYIETNLEISIQDNGKGFDVRNSNKSNLNNGLGISNMLQRAELINGDIKILSSAKSGTLVVLRLSDL
jgi:two-component system NarL family sensor kinase